MTVVPVTAVVQDFFVQGARLVAVIAVTASVQPVRVKTLRLRAAGDDRGGLKGFLGIARAAGGQTARVKERGFGLLPPLRIAREQFFQRLQGGRPSLCSARNSALSGAKRRIFFLAFLTIPKESATGTGE
jgi:hypothetical protein